MTRKMQSRGNLRQGAGSAELLDLDLSGRFLSHLRHWNQQHWCICVLCFNGDRPVRVTHRVQIALNSHGSSTSENTQNNRAADSSRHLTSLQHQHQLSQHLHTQRRQESSVNRAARSADCAENRKSTFCRYCRGLTSETKNVITFTYYVLPFFLSTWDPGFQESSFSRSTSLSTYVI